MDTMMTEKSAIAFKLMDFNRDGTVDVKDRDDCIQSFLRVFKPEGEKERKMKTKLNEFWDKIVFLTEVPNWSKSFSPDEILASRKNAYTKDSAKTISIVRDALTLMVEAGNVNESESISYEEFKVVHEAFNQKDENIVKGIFSMIGKDENNKCSVDNIADFYTELAMGSDENKHGQYKAALESVGFM